MQVNRLSVGLQEELKTVTNFGTPKTQNLFDYQASTAASANSPKAKSKDFSEIDTKDLAITPDQIEELLNGFTDEVLKVFSTQMQNDNPLRDPSGGGNGEQESSPAFTA